MNIFEKEPENVDEVEVVEGVGSQPEDGERQQAAEGDTGKEEASQLESRIEEERARFIAWAESIGKDEEWVDKTFTFYEDGSAVCEGDLDLRGVASLISFPPDISEVRGNLDMRDVTSLANVHLPEKVHGSVYLIGATELTGVRLPTHVDGAVVLSGLRSLEEVKLPEYVGGGLMLDSLEELGNTAIDWPKHIGGDVTAQKLPSWAREKVRAQMEEQGSDATNRVL